MLSLRFKLFTLLTDAIVFLLLSLAVFTFRMESPGSILMSSPGFWFVLAILLTFQYVMGNYDLNSEKWRSLFLRIFLSLLVSFSVVIVFNYLLGKDRSGLFGRGILLSTIFLFGIYSVIFRFIIWKSFSRQLAAKEWTFIISETTQPALTLALEKNRFQGQVRMLGLQDEFKVNRQNQIVIGVPSSLWTAKMSEKLIEARLLGQKIMDLSSFYEQVWKQVAVNFLGPEWFVLENGFKLLQNPWQLRMKRLGDLVLSFILLILVWPILLLTAIAIKLDSAGDIFYRQIRTGHSGKPFQIIKFRSMRSDAEKSGQAVWAEKNDQRITKIGKLLRLTRIDELPQIWNVFKGEMSFIGPRPERPEFNEQLEKVIPYYQMRHLVRPGITGWAQILYPYGASIDDSREKLQYDLFYIKNYSLILDLKIVLKTVQVILLGRGR